MSKEEFRKEVEEFWVWASDRDKTFQNWLLTLEEWAIYKYKMEQKRRR